MHLPAPHEHVGSYTVRARSSPWAREELVFVFEVGDIHDVLADWLMAHISHGRCAGVWEWVCMKNVCLAEIELSSLSS